MNLLSIKGWVAKSHDHRKRMTENEDDQVNNNRKTTIMAISIGTIAMIMCDKGNANENNENKK